MKIAKLTVFLFCALLVGKSSQAGMMAPAPSSSGAPAVAQQCSLPPGWDAIAARKPRFVVFGELHGTRQAPAFVGDVACALAARGVRILVGVEHFSSENAAYQQAWRLPDARFAAALTRTGWATHDDGVGSEAMLDLLVRLHHLARHGQSIDIVAFNGARDEAQASRFAHLPGQGPHEAAQAENIRLAAGARPYDHVLVLVGNLHARKRPVDHGVIAFEPMAMHLGPPAAVVSLNIAYADGTAWNCQPKPGVRLEPHKPMTSDAIDCGSHPAQGSTDLHRAPFMALSALPGAQPDPDYDGFFWLGTINASPPAGGPRRLEAW